MKLDNNISLKNKLLNTDWGNTFTTWQKEEILRGIDLGVDITKYAFPFVKPLQMKVLCEMLRYNFDISQLDLRQLNIAQLNAIMRGIIDKVDVSIYYDPQFHASQMEFLEKCLVNGEDVSKFAKGVDISRYADPKYDNRQLSEIYAGICENLDVSRYDNEAFEAEQMWELRLGLKHGIDISVFNNPKFAFNQMDEIRQGLAENLNVEIYAKPTFDVGQMREIKKGLERNIDVSKYANMYVDSRKMALIRILLEQGYNVSTVADPTINTWEAQRRAEKTLNKRIDTNDLWK